MKTTARDIHLANDPLLRHIDNCLLCGNTACKGEPRQCDSCLLGVRNPPKIVHIEQIDRDEREPGVRGFLKRRLARIMRRAAKKDPENAPTKPAYRGYSLWQVLPKGRTSGK